MLRQLDGPCNDLFPFIDRDGITALNAAGDTAKGIFKPYDQRLERDQCLASEDGDPQLIIRVPFVCPVKVRAFTVIGGRDGTAPRSSKFFINHETLDFGDAEDGQQAVQCFDLVEDAYGTVEYRTQFSKFQNVSTLWIFVTDNHGADRSLINYIGLSGVATEHKRQAVETVYELLCVGCPNDPLKDGRRAPPAGSARRPRAP